MSPQIWYSSLYQTTKTNRWSGPLKRSEDIVESLITKRGIAWFCWDLMIVNFGLRCKRRSIQLFIMRRLFGYRYCSLYDVKSINGSEQDETFSLFVTGRGGDVDISRRRMTTVWREDSRLTDGRMVRLHVRKSLLSAWTSSRRRRCVHRRAPAASAAAAAGDDDGRDIRLDVLLFACCCSSDSASCCCCCVQDEKCQGNLPATSSFLYVLLLCDCFRPDGAHAPPRGCRLMRLAPAVIVFPFLRCVHAFS